MVKKLYEGHNIPSSLREALEEDWDNFITDLNNKVEHGDPQDVKNVTVEDLIDMFLEEFGGVIYNNLFYIPHADFFKGVQAVSVDEIMKYYNSNQDELSVREATYAVASALQRKFAEQHRQELEQFVEEFNFISDSNRKIKNRPNYESLRRKRNRK